ncbi:MAG: hypothetical protein IJ417_08085 [Bacteroidaceae bacterium]|nr:hypothetical protein [Bacteroidaceae bacterium]
MNSFLKNLGLILTILGAIILFVCFATGNTNSNALLATSVGLIIVGIIAYIVLNKNITE